MIGWMVDLLRPEYIGVHQAKPAIPPIGIESRLQSLPFIEVRSIVIEGIGAEYLTVILLCDSDRPGI